MSVGIDFDFIKKVGEDVRSIYLNDPNQVDWFYNIADDYKINSEYPPNLILTIISHLDSIDDEDSKKIIDDIRTIIQDEDNVDNLLDYIFFPAFGEEEEEEADSNINSKSLSIQVEEDEEEEEINVNNLDPKQYFDSIVKKVKDTLSISQDISYVLCKKYNLNKDLIFQKWLSSQDEVLKLLRIKAGSEMVPDFKSPLTIKSCGIGECPICYNETEIFQLYCGHKICKECLLCEITELIKQGQVPVCRQTIEDEENDEICSSEIMMDDIKNFLNDDELFEKYQKVILDKETSVFQGVRKCPNEYCDSIITPLNEISCNVGRCSQCGAFVCLKCRQECHAPLISCSKVDDFFVTLAESMKQLLEDQKKWVKREKSLISLRMSNNRKEIHSNFNVQIQTLKRKYTEINKEQSKIISIMNSELQRIHKEIVHLRQKRINLDPESTEYKILSNEIKKVQASYNQKEVIIKRRQIDYENQIRNQNVELESYEKEELLLCDCYSLTGSFKASFFNYEVFMNGHAISRIKLLSQDWIKSQYNKEQDERTAEAVITGIFKRCPNCNTPIERISGCNHMTCGICGFQFCYICGGPWSDHIGYICPKYSLGSQMPKSKVKKQPKGDKTNFYQPPMSVEKRVDYFRYNNAFSQFQINKEKYDKLFADFKNKKNLKREPGEIVYSDSKLCTRNKIAKVLLKDVERDKIKMKTYSIMNQVLFAQSVIMWGYPALYYMINNPDKAMLFEYKLFLLEEATNNFVSILQNPKNSTTKDFDTNVNVLESQIKCILEMAEEF